MKLLFRGVPIGTTFSSEKGVYTKINEYKIQAGSLDTANAVNLKDGYLSFFQDNEPVEVNDFFVGSFNLCFGDIVEGTLFTFEKYDGVLFVKFPLIRVDMGSRYCEFNCFNTEEQTLCNADHDDYVFLSTSASVDYSIVSNGKTILRVDNFGED